MIGHPHQPTKQTVNIDAVAHSPIRPAASSGFPPRRCSDLRQLSSEELKERAFQAEQTWDDESDQIPW